ncbi:MAG: hypothetical protein JO264_19135 [Acidisphaera sp.]|nr:hypothetical protein [Acidisphaera sp.]
MLRLKLFGQMEAWVDGRALVLPRSRKARGLLAVLTVSAPASVLRPTLWRLLWSQRGADQARGSLRQALHDLAECLAPITPSLLRADRFAVALNADGILADVHELARATAERPEPLALIQGEFLEELSGLDPAFDKWLAIERRRLGDAARQIARAALLQQTEPDAVITAADRLLTLDPTHEDAWRALMRAHAERGERALVVELYARCKKVLADLLKTAPSPETEAIVADIRWAEQSGGILRPNSNIRTPGRLLGRGIRVAVLPPRDIGQETDPSLSVGLAEEITTALARFRHISVLSDLSISRLEAETGSVGLDIRQQGFGFILDGTVQKSRGRVRVMMRLLDLRASGEAIWVQRFDHEADDLLSLQDQIAGQIAAQVDTALLMQAGPNGYQANGSSRNGADGPSADLTAEDLVLQAVPCIYQLDRDAFNRAGDLLRRAVALDPQDAAAHGWLACWNIFLIGQGWAESSTEAMRRAGAAAERAVALDPTDARGLTIAGHVRAFLYGRLEEARALHSRAIVANPNLPLAWVLSGLTQSYRGEHDEALRLVRQAIKLSPLDPHSYFFDMALMIAHLMKGDFDTVVNIGHRAIELNPWFSSTLKAQIAALGHLGLRAEIEEIRAKLVQIEPDFSVQRALATMRHVRPEDRLLYETGLRLAGIH